MIEVEGASEAIAAIGQMYDEEEIQGISEGTLHRLQLIAMDMTPVQTGSMRNAWVVENLSLTIDSGARNSRTGVPVTDYAPEVAERVGVMNALMARIEGIAEEEAQRYGYQ